MALVSKTFSEIITFTRASTATYFDSAGVLQSAAIDTPRLDYNPSTLAAQGLLIEESRTNSIRNNTMVGAAAGTPGTLPTNWLETLTAGLTREVVGTGTENGITYIDIRVSGTAGAATSFAYGFETITTIVAATGQTWASSVYLKLAAGSLSGISGVSLRVIERTVAGALVQTDTGSSFTLTSTLTRQQSLFTLSGGATVERLNPYIFLIPVNGAAIDITLRIGLPQLELGAFATSVIPTTTVAVTRSADVASVNTLTPWYNASAGTLYAEFQTSITASAIQASFNNTTANNRLGVGSSSSSFLGLRNTGGAGVLFTPATANAPSLVNANKSALAFANLDYAISGNGGTVATASTYNLPTVTKLELGSQLSGTFINGYLRRITYYPRRLTNAELQTITA